MILFKAKFTTIKTPSEIRELFRVPVSDEQITNVQKALAKIDGLEVTVGKHWHTDKYFRLKSWKNEDDSKISDFITTIEQDEYLLDEYKHRSVKFAKDLNVYKSDPKKEILFDENYIELVEG